METLQSMLDKISDLKRKEGDEEREILMNEVSDDFFDVGVHEVATETEPFAIKDVDTPTTTVGDVNSHLLWIQHHFSEINN